MQDSQLFKKVFGCIMGGVTGDALGGPVEEMTADFIRELHGGRVTEMQSYLTRPDHFSKPKIPGCYAWDDKPGTYTDDSYFSLLNAQCIIAHNGRVTCDDMADFYIRHMDVRRAWHTMEYSYRKLYYTDITARKAGRGNMNESSTSMSIAPFGIINACNPSQAALDAYDCMLLAHDDFGCEAAGALAAAVAEAFKPDATVDSVADAALAYLPGRTRSAMYRPLSLAIELARQAKDSDELTKLYYDRLIIDWHGRGDTAYSDDQHAFGGMPMESVSCAIGMFVNAGGDARKTIVGAVNFGRDCDTIGCMAGYIAGAFGGIDALPQTWVQTCLSANPDPDLTVLAEKLTTAVIEQNRRDRAKCSTIEGMLK